MNANPDIAAVAKLIGDSARARMLLALLSGRALSAGELARAANVSPQTASSHLAQLSSGKLLALERGGRHRYYRLASTEVALAIEALMAISPTRPQVREAHNPDLEPIQFCRTCYDHLAGKVGVALTDALLARQALETVEGGAYRVTPGGEATLSDFGVEVASLKKGRRQLARQCLDWTERRYHLAGALGAALADRLFELKWLVRLERSRVVQPTSRGLEGLGKTFGLEL